MAETVYILLGSNVGDREKYLQQALDKMAAIEGLEIIASSSIYNTEAQDMFGENPPFLNQVVMAEYQYLPMELLDQLEKIEKELDRDKKGRRQPRTIDLDILLFGEQEIHHERLSIPHKELCKRPFALIPLLQITPDAIHPVKQKPLSEYVKKSDEKKVILYKDHVARNI